MSDDDYDEQCYKSKKIEKDMDVQMDKIFSNKLKDKSDNSLSEKVIDRQVRLALFQFINKGMITSVYGCVSAGKEANVYFAKTPESTLSYAIKIYKSSILDYKDRRRYLEGDFRLKFWNVGHNSRRIVKKWAEKEMRNLIRIYEAGVPCPKPVKIKDLILVMHFLGDSETGQPYPLLKDVSIDSEVAVKVFIQAMCILKNFYSNCKLVHGDFSEFNLLLDVEKCVLYVIDVSQSVENRSPRALDFLKEDIHNILYFFSKRHLLVLPSLQTCFYLITCNMTVEKMEEFFEFFFGFEQTIDVYFDDYVFRNVPTTLDTTEASSLKVFIDQRSQFCRETYCLDIFGEFEEDEQDDESEETSSTSKTSTSEEVSSDSAEIDEEPQNINDKESKKAERKLNKIKVKEEKREKRKTKMKKKDKKGLINKTKRRKGH